MAALTQEKLAQPMLSTQAIGFCIGTSANQIPECLVGLIWNPNGSEITAAEQASQLERIASIGLDFHSWLHGDQRRSNYDALNAHCRQLSMQSVTGWPSLVRDAELDVWPTQAGDELAYRRGFIGNAAEAGGRLVALGHSCSDAGAVHV